MSGEVKVNYVYPLDPLETKYGVPVLSGSDLIFVDPGDNNVCIMVNLIDQCREWCELYPSQTVLLLANTNTSSMLFPSVVAQRRLLTFNLNLCLEETCGTSSLKKPKLYVVLYLANDVRRVLLTPLADLRGPYLRR
jgi:hypothetical protein